MSLNDSLLSFDYVPNAASPAVVYVEVFGPTQRQVVRRSLIGRTCFHAGEGACEAGAGALGCWGAGALGSWPKLCPALEGPLAGPGEAGGWPGAQGAQGAFGAALQSPVNSPCPRDSVLPQGSGGVRASRRSR